MKQGVSYVQNSGLGVYIRNIIPDDRGILRRRSWPYRDGSMPNFREFSFCSGQDSSPIHSGLLLCLVGRAIGDTRRTRVDPTIEDEAAARAGAAARATCDVGTLHGTYLFADNGVFAPTGQHFAGAGYEYYDGNGNIHGVFSSNFDGHVTRNEHYSATYEVNTDCTGRSTYPGDMEYKYDLFIDPGGEKFAWVQTKPRRSEVVSGVSQRVIRQRVGD